MNTPNDYIGTEVAIVGMAARFPGAPDVDTYWQNLRDGVESVTFHSVEELIDEGADPERVRDPNFVPASLDFEGMEAFDAGFFGFSPRDAEIMDPQHRVFLECAWHALEHAGHDPKAYPGAIGVYAGIGPNDYYIYNLLRNEQLMDSVGEWLVRHTSNDKDFFATRISYELDLRGPSVNIQTACSTSLVSVHLASQSLISGECDMALAGGVTLLTRDEKGYIYRPGEILSPDGHCRAFDEDARGTLFGSGAGLVVLKRYDEAVADGDTIHAVIRGSAVNNDGAQKVGYMAPSVDGQTAAVTEAIAMAGIDPESISYVEAHGTGTSVGDPIEVRALSQAFRSRTGKTQYCGIGSVKSNIGHLDHAAGVSSLIKTVLALKNKQIPPTLNYERPNPKMDIERTPFYVNDTLRDWTPPDGAPRRAGVNSLGIGGTNAHVILEEAPEREPETSSRPAHVLPISARTPSALDTANEQLAQHLRAHPDEEIADVAYTLQLGRRGFEHRRAVVCRGPEDAIATLTDLPPRRVAKGTTRDSGRPVALLFPGQGAQYATMGRDLYDEEPVFRQHVDRCAERLKPLLGVDLRDLLFPGADAVEGANNQLKQTAYTQPALFVIQYATAQQWMHWGIKPTAMIGHSIGEYAAACLAGVMSLDDALKLVVERGRLMQAMEPGTMLSIGASEEEVESYLDGPVTVSVINGPAMCVVGGSEGAVQALKERLDADDIPCRPLETSHAFHSAMMEPALAPFQEVVEAARLHPPEIPFVSNMTGTWITDDEATDPAYWAQHIRRAVRFSDGIATLLGETDAALLEVGPGTTLSSLTRQHPAHEAGRTVVNSLRHPREEASDAEYLMRALGQLWVAGVDVNWGQLYAGEARCRIPLPRYPFERTSYWIDPDPAAQQSADEKSPSDAAQPALTKQPDMDDWFYVPSWTRSAPPARPESLPSGGTWLVFEDEYGVTNAVLEQVEAVYAQQETHETPRRLALETPGELDSLSLKPTERVAPGRGAIEVRVHAAGLQFKDILMALGMYADEPVPMGAECAGTVVRVGEGVTDFEVGDEVIVGGFDSFRSFVTRDARMAVQKPATLSFEDAVTIPSGFLTAYHSLIRVANLQPGERVLIHAASGGVGQSAVQIAQMVGAEVFGTAGSPRKRAFLRDELNIEHVYDSRSLDFADGIRADTEREGVDVVLNSVTGEAIKRGLEILRPHGRFLELGKKDLYDPGTLPEVPNRDTIAYTIIDMDAEREERTEAFQELFQDVIDHIEAGRLDPLPRTVFPWEQASDAFQYMSATKHIGKVVLAIGPSAPTVVRVTPGNTFQDVAPRRFTIRPHVPEDYAALVTALGSTNIRHVIHSWNVTSAQDDRSESAFWEEEKERIFYSLFHLGKALAAEDRDEPLPIDILSNGMQRIASEQELRPSKATLLGPCRVIPREFPMLQCRSIDLGLVPDGAEPHEPVIDGLVGELLAPPQERFVAYRGMDRWRQGVERSPIPASDGAAPALRHDGVYLITGGLGGIGLTIADHLARSKRVKLVLTSRTGLPPRDEWAAWMRDHDESDPVRTRIRAVLALEDHGAEVLVGATDVTNRDGMGALVEDIRERFGSIDGVIHAAGVVDDDLLPLKAPTAAARVLAPKVEGTLVLDDVLTGQPLDFLVLFSSVSALVGPPGQVDYAAANAFLDAFAQRKRTVDGVPALSINWSAWQEVGMAAELASSDPEEAHEGQPVAHPLLDRRLDDGSSTVFQSTLAPRDHWILDGHRNTHGEAILPGTGYLELARAAFAELTGRDAMELAEVYFVAPLEIRSGTKRSLRVRLDPEGENTPFTIESRPLEDAANVQRWDVHAQGIVRALDATSSENGDTPETVLNLSAIKNRCSQVVHTPSREDRSQQEKHLHFGPRWRGLNEVRYGHGEAIAEVELPAVFSGDLHHYKLHPAVLDVATGFGLPLLDGYGQRDDFYVPIGYDTLRLYRPLPQRIHSHMRCLNASEDELPSFDVTLMDAQGRVVADVSSFKMKRVPAEALTASPDQEEQRPGLDSTGESLTVDLAMGVRPGEGVKAFDRILATRSQPQVIVSTVDLPAWQARIDEMTAPLAEEADAEGDAPAPPSDDAASEADASFIAPRDDVERTIANFWKGMLGLDRVGLHDDFFDVGGHSLIAVRMFAKVRKEYGLDLPLSVLMEAPTLSAFSDVVRGELGIEPPAKEASAVESDVEDNGVDEPQESTSSDDAEPVSSASTGDQADEDRAESAPVPSSADPASDGAASAVEKPPAITEQRSTVARPRDRAWSPLVPIQKEGTMPPFFCVHGAGGNVLNFRDLAQYLGKDQPFYGLQARGVEGKRTPHKRIEDMAAEYVAAIQDEFPKGPYLLGGFSGGGCIAYEMAQQLTARGEKVPLLVLFDAPLPNRISTPRLIEPSDMKSSVESNIERTLGLIESEGLLSTVARGTRRLTAVTRAKYGILKLYARRGVVSLLSNIKITIPVGMRHLYVRRPFFKAVMNYNPRPYDGYVLLFTTEDNLYLRKGTEDDLGWGSCIGNLEVRKIECEHDGILKSPWVKRVSVELSEKINLTFNEQNNKKSEVNSVR